MAGDSKSKIIQFVNCRILKDHKIQKEDLWVRGSQIINPECVFFDEQVRSDVQIDCDNAIIAPGFIDLQINGGFGVDFSQPSGHFQKDLETVAKGLLAHGVTSFCPTIVTSPTEIYHQIIPQTILKPGGEHGATILGLHLEGPFIHPQKKGAHPEELIKTLDAGISTLFNTYGTLENVRIITLAPEFPNAPAVIEQLVKKDITVAIGHSMGNLVDGVTAVKHGATLITHLFNAMLPFHHRDPGLVGLLTSDEVLDGKTVYFGIIADGIHTHPAALRIAHRTHPEGLVIVTDAVSALGLKEGIHYIGRMAIEVRNSSAYVANTNATTLCGSIASMNKCIQTFKKATNCSTVYALEAATLHPAKAIGIEQNKGTLNYGSDADFVFLDNDLQVLSTYIGGELVYNHCPK